MMHSGIISYKLIVINHKSVSLKMVPEICLIDGFDGRFDLDLIFQGHPTYGKNAQ